MSQPDFDNWQDPGYGYDTYEVAGIVTTASNIVFGNNPSYTVVDFQAFYPQFATNLFPTGVLQLFINLANACLSYDRWFDNWQLGMSLYVAHFATLFLQSQVPAGATAKQVVAAGLAKGIQASKSVADVSVSYQMVVTGWEQWGSFNLTLYGQQFITMASIIGMGPIYVW